MKQVDERDRPREKLQRKGPQSLSDTELIAALLGSGGPGRDVFELAREVQKVIAQGVHDLDLKRVRTVKGMGMAKAGQVVAAFELAKRHLIRKVEPVRGVEDIVRLCQDLVEKRQEYFQTITLDGAHNVIEKRTVFIGTLNESLIHPREVFADAISDRAASLILVHNHPSGTLEPSEEDLAVTRRLVEVGKLVGIGVLDHVIVGRSGYFSFQEGGLV